MIVTVLAGGVSFVIGVATGGAGVLLRTGKKANAVQLVDHLTDTDRDQVARDFAVHVHSTQRKVSEYADALADGDDDLRNRLRHFEKDSRP